MSLRDSGMHRHPSNSVSFRTCVIFSVTGLLVGLIIGYFVGREHVKYEIKSALSGAAEEFGKGLSRAFSSGNENDDSRPMNPAEAEIEQSAQAPPSEPRERTLTSVSFLNLQEEDYATTLSFEITNKSGKHMKAFVGFIRIYDQFGEHLSSFKVNRDDPVANGESYTKSGTWVGVDNRTKKLLRQWPTDLNIVFEMEQVIYADGSVEKF